MYRMGIWPVATYIFRNDEHKQEIYLIAFMVFLGLISFLDVCIGPMILINIWQFFTKWIEELLNINR